ncbi:unnamed protein product [Cyprideis torosa]|uniref:Uncharacterized protein n=1 Tax=Cyprideis torosa TaxID=163714 RepID=A0A7R8WHX1_9CRUS|nr:unnamed protein product [Cyprideis torosa]CAG0899956.1 unnamed protein product [Cyprideis torosa]
MPVSATNVSPTPPGSRRWGDRKSKKRQASALASSQRFNKTRHSMALGPAICHLGHHVKTNRPSVIIAQVTRYIPVSTGPRGDDGDQLQADLYEKQDVRSIP